MLLSTTSLLKLPSLSYFSRTPPLPNPPSLSSTPLGPPPLRAGFALAPALAMQRRIAGETGSCLSLKAFFFRAMSLEVPTWVVRATCALSRSSILGLCRVSSKKNDAPKQRTLISREPEDPNFEGTSHLTKLRAGRWPLLFLGQRTMVQFSRSLGSAAGWAPRELQTELAEFLRQMPPAWEKPPPPPPIFPYCSCCPQNPKPQNPKP